MGFRGFVAAVLDIEPNVVYECRRCGATVDPGDGICPYCGPTEVVKFDLRE